MQRIYPCLHAHRERVCQRLLQGVSCWPLKDCLSDVCRSPSKNVLPVPLSEGEDWHAGDSPHSQTSSRGVGGTGLLGTPKAGSLGSEAGHSSAENIRLASDNARLAAENKKLAEQ